VLRKAAAHYAKRYREKIQATPLTGEHYSTFSQNLTGRIKQNNEYEDL